MSPVHETTRRPRPRGSAGRLTAGGIALLLAAVTAGCGHDSAGVTGPSAAGPQSSVESTTSVGSDASAQTAPLISVPDDGPAVSLAVPSGAGGARNAAAFGVGAGGASPAPPPTAAPRTTGRPGLLWIDDLDEQGFGDLVVAQLDGTQPRRLVDDKVISAVWSTDGERIALLRDDQPAGSGLVHTYGVHVVNADGTGLRLVTATVAEPYTWPGGLAWSPDGTTLAYHDGTCTYAGCHVSIWTIDLATGTKTRLTAAACDFQGAWSPDGRQIAFVRYVGTASQVWVINANGTGLRPVSPLVDAATDPLSNFISSPAWSPDGELIAYDRGWDVWVVDADGSKARPLIEDRPSDDVWRHSPVWAPDGSRLVVLDWGFNRTDRILVVSRDGNVERAIATDGALEWGPSWSPDGQMVTAERWLPDTRLPLHHHPVDGSPPTELTVTARSPSFSPAEPG